MTKSCLKTGVDLSPKTSKKQFRQWTQRNECILLIKHRCHSLTYLVHLDTNSLISTLSNIITFTCHWRAILSCWRHLYCNFIYIYSLLMEEGLCECRNVTVKFPCVYLCLSSGSLQIFNKSSQPMANYPECHIKHVCRIKISVIMG